MGEVLGKVSGCSCTQLAEFYSAEAGVSIWRCCFRMSVKSGSQDGYSYFFAKKCTSKRGLAVIYPKLWRYYLVDLVVKHECEMVSVTHKFKPDRVIAPRNCNQQPRVVKIDLILYVSRRGYA